MYISDINYKIQSKIYLLASLACILFSTIYEMFSHEVYSTYMISAFAIPLILGCFVSLILFKKQNRKENILYNEGVATLTIGSIIKGFLEIYGTTNYKVVIYLIVGVSFILISVGSTIIRNKKQGR